MPGEERDDSGPLPTVAPATAVVAAAAGAAAAVAAAPPFWHTASTAREPMGQAAAGGPSCRVLQVPTQQPPAQQPGPLLQGQQQQHQQQAALLEHEEASRSQPLPQLVHNQHQLEPSQWGQDGGQLDLVKLGSSPVPSRAEAQHAEHASSAPWRSGEMHSQPLPSLPHSAQPAVAAFSGPTFPGVSPAPAGYPGLPGPGSPGAVSPIGSAGGMISYGSGPALAPRKPRAQRMDALQQAESRERRKSERRLSKGAQISWSTCQIIESRELKLLSSIGSGAYGKVSAVGLGLRVPMHENWYVCCSP